MRADGDVPAERFISYAGPHLPSPEPAATIFWTIIATLGVPVLFSLALFGRYAVIIYLLSVSAAVGSEWLYLWLTSRPRTHTTLTHAVLIGLLFAMTLPPLVGFHVPVVGAAVAVLIGKCIQRGLGNYLLHPALVGRLVVQFFFANKAGFTHWPVLRYLFWYDPAFELWPVLARGKLFFGDLHDFRHIAAVTPNYEGWFVTPTPPHVDAWLMRRPIELLREYAGGFEPTQMVGEPLRALTAAHIPPEGISLGQILVNRLVPIVDTIVGTVGGGIGEVSAVALLAVVLFLIYRGYVKWCLPVAMLIAASVAATILPLRIGPHDAAGRPTWVWLPAVSRHLWIGLTYIGYHLFCGEMLMGAVMLCADPASRPITKYGQVVFGAAVGMLAVVMRLYVTFPMATYGAILLLGFAVPAINRLTRPRPAICRPKVRGAGRS